MNAGIQQNNYLFKKIGILHEVKIILNIRKQKKNDYTLYKHPTIVIKARTDSVISLHNIRNEKKIKSTFITLQKNFLKNRMFLYIIISTVGNNAKFQYVMF